MTRSEPTGIVIELESSDPRTDVDQEVDGGSHATEFLTISTAPIPVSVPFPFTVSFDTPSVGCSQHQMIMEAPIALISDEHQLNPSKNGFESCIWRRRSLPFL